MDNKLYHIETEKYRGFGEILFFLLVSAVSLGIAAANLYTAKGEGPSAFRWLGAVDSFLFAKIIVAPIFLAAVAGRSVEIESHRDMWKVIRTAGIDLSRIYAAKFRYCLRKVALYQGIEWVFLLGMIAYTVATPAPWGRIAFAFLGQFAVSFLLLALHYAMALYRGDARLSASVALVGTLTGLVFLFLPEVFSLVNPYSWYGRLLQIGYDYTEKTPVRYLLVPSYGIVAAAVALGLLVLFVAIKRGVRE